jgi:hypothetical protein
MDARDMASDVDNGFAAAEADQILGNNAFLKPATQLLGIVCGDAESDRRSDASKSFGLAAGELGKSLMSECQANTVFSGFGDNRFQRIRGEPLRLVHVKMKQPPLLVRHIASTDCRSIDQGQNQGPRDALQLSAKSRQIDE